MDPYDMVHMILKKLHVGTIGITLVKTVISKSMTVH